METLLKELVADILSEKKVPFTDEIIGEVMEYTFSRINLDGLLKLELEPIEVTLEVFESRYLNEYPEEDRSGVMSALITALKFVFKTLNDAEDDE